MKAKELMELIKQGKNPVIKFNEGVYEWMLEAADPFMMGKIIDASTEDEDNIRFLVELNEFEKHNRSVAAYDWSDTNGEGTLCWFDTIFYPKDGKDVIYLPRDENVEVAFDLVHDSSLITEYSEIINPDGSYMEWLEREVIRLRSL